MKVNPFQEDSTFRKVLAASGLRIFGRGAIGGVNLFKHQITNISKYGSYPTENTRSPLQQISVYVIELMENNRFLF